MPQTQRSSRNKKIEPLSWEAAAQSPALKGMTSFLDIPAEDIRAGRYVGVLAINTQAGAVRYPGDDTRAGAVPTISDVDLDSGDLIPRISPLERDAPKEVAPPLAPSTESTQGKSRPVSLKTKRSPLESPQSPVVVTFPAQTGSPVVAFATPAGTHPGLKAPVLDEKYPAPASSPGVEGGTGIESYPGDERYPGNESSSSGRGGVTGGSQVTPGRGRSKVRRCVLAQDGHSLGEEAIYQVMWRGARAESQDPNASRTIRIGAADIGYKVNMAKKNVRQNISRLYEKLALEILEDFETISSQPRLYRIFSYRQILERRRAAGMEFILRNKGVVFCTSNGEQMISSPAYVLTPGDETSPRPAPPKKRKSPRPPLMTLPPPRVSAPSVRSSAEDSSTDVELIAGALNRYWPVDQAAAEQLLRDCRSVRPDARVEEIVFFVAEKLEIARNNRKITSPTGLVLATVPKSFAGTMFQSFRERMERQRALIDEENARREREQEELRSWFYKEREKNEAIVNDAGKTQQERDAAEKKLRQFAAWNP